MIVVLHLGFRQRGPAVNAPVHGLLALVDNVAFDELSECAYDVRLIAESHRQVRLVPLAADAEPLELLRHDSDEALGISAAGAPDVGRRHVALLRAELTVDFQLNRQPVAVVARHVGRVEAGHRPRLHDEVFEDLVEGCPEVNLAVGVGRAIVEDELGCTAAPCADLTVQVHRFPSRDGLRFSGLQVGLHRKTCAGQVYRVFPLGHKPSF